MTEKAFNELFSKNLNYFLDLNEKTQKELATYVGVSTSSVSSWCKGQKTPRMDKVDKICEFFNIKRSDLMEDRKSKQDEGYYLNEETRELAQEIYENKDLRILLDATRNLDPEDINFVVDMVNRMKG